MTRCSLPDSPNLANAAATAGSADVLLLGQDDVAHLLGISKSKVKSLIRSGQLPAVRLGDRPMVSSATLRDFVAALPPAKAAHVSCTAEQTAQQAA